MMSLQRIPACNGKDHIDELYVSQTDREAHRLVSNMKQTARRNRHEYYVDSEETTSTNSCKATKSVKFSTIVRVCLIPQREEFELIKHDVWWDKHNLETFRADACRELYEFMKYCGCTMKEGMYLLYQYHHSSLE